MLLDTHTLLWFLSNDPKLTTNTRNSIENADHIVVSIITLWEIAIKLSIQKLALDFAFEELPSFLGQLEIDILLVSVADVQQYINLPLHHRDPFDRMLIAQAVTHSLAIISADTIFDAYPIQRMWV